jgi:hypothetical protein
MEWFKQKKEAPKDVQITPDERFEQLSSKHRALERRLLDLEMDFNVLRDKVLRKIQERRKEPDSTSVQPEQLNTTLLPGQATR